MEKIILIVHMLAALGIIGLILLQQGKGAEAGASFGGGASQTVFGSGGGGNFFTRLTGILATIFFITSFSLAAVSRQNAGVDADEGIPTLVTQPESDVPAAAPSNAEISESELPSLEEIAGDAESDLPEITEQASEALDEAAAQAESAAEQLKQNVEETAAEVIEEVQPQ